MRLVWASSQPPPSLASRLPRQPTSPAVAIPPKPQTLVSSPSPSTPSPSPFPPSFAYAYLLVRHPPFPLFPCHPPHVSRHARTPTATPSPTLSLSLVRPNTDVSTYLSLFGVEGAAPLLLELTALLPNAALRATLSDSLRRLLGLSISMRLVTRPYGKLSPSVFSLRSCSATAC